MEIGTFVDKNQRGVKVEVEDAYVVLTAYNQDFYRVYEEECAAYRAEAGLAEDADIPGFAHIPILHRSILKTTVKGWGGYTLDGVELSDKNGGDALHLENGMLLMGPGGQAKPWIDAIEKLSGYERKKEETQQGNSLAPSPTN